MMPDDPNFTPAADPNAAPQPDPNVPPVDPNAAPADPNATGGDGEPATPEEESAMEAALNEAGKSLYQNGKVWASIKKMLATQPVPKAVAEITKQIVAKVDGEQNLPETVILQFALSVAMMITDAATETGLIQIDENVVKECLSETAQVVLEAYGATPEETDAAVADINPDEIKQGLSELGAIHGQ